MVTRSSSHRAEEAADAAQALIGLSGTIGTRGRKKGTGGDSNAAELQCRSRTRGVSLVAGAYRALNGTPDRTGGGHSREIRSPVVYHASDEELDLGVVELEEEEEQEDEDDEKEGEEQEQNENDEKDEEEDEEDEARGDVTVL